MTDKVQILVKHNDKVVSTLTLHPVDARAFLWGEDVTIELGGYDPNGPFCTRASAYWSLGGLKDAQSPKG